MKGAKIRVLHLIESAGIYGAENVILGLSAEMRASGTYVPVVGCILQRHGETSELLAAAQSAGLEVLPLIIPNRSMPIALFRAARQVAAAHIDVIHSHGYKPSVYAFIIAKLTRARPVATCHLWYVGDDAPLKMRLMIRIEKSLYRHFPAVVAVSDEIRQILIANGVPPGRTLVIKNGISLDVARAHQQMRPARTRVRVLNVGRLTAQKAQADVIAAAALISKSRQGVEFWIAGEGELRDDLDAQIVESNLLQQVRLLGYRDDVRNLLAETDIFVLPSVKEGMPVSLLEAVAARVTVVATAVGDIPKLIVNGESGLVVRTHDVPGLAAAILQLVDDPTLGARLAESAWQRMASQFSSRQMFEAYDAIYGSLLPTDRARQDSPA